MAFCAVTEQNIERLTHRVFFLIRSNPVLLKDFKTFTHSIVNELVTKNATLEKAITLAAYLPQIVSEYNSDKENRRALKEAGVSIDSITDVEDRYDSYESLAKFLDIKNDTNPIVVVNEKQQATEKQLDDIIGNTIVTFKGSTRYINRKKYDTRVTSIAKVGYDSSEENNDSPALKHGNTVDAIAKTIFDGKNVKYSDFEDLITEKAFNNLVGQLKKVKSSLEEKGFTFKTGVTVYNKALSISGEIDLLLISPEGKAFVADFKTAGQRFNDSYLKKDNLRIKSDDIQYELGMLSKAQQYFTQGHIYALLLKDMGVTNVAENSVSIIGTNIVYDSTVPSAESTITDIGDIKTIQLGKENTRSVFKDKNLQEIYDIYKSLESKSLGGVTEIKPIVKTRKKLDNPSKRQTLDRIAVIDEVAATSSELQDEIKWFKNNPIGKDTLLQIDTIVNSGLFGKWTLDGITLFDKASKGTVYHEGWHRFSQVFLTKTQKDSLYKSVQNDSIDFRTRDGRKINTSKAEFLDVEEFLADEFAKFGLNPEGYSYPKDNKEPKNIFQKIWDFLTRYFGVNPRPIDLFQKLYRGQISRYSPSVNNAYWGTLNSLATDENGDEIVSNERFPLYVQSMDYLINKELKDAGKSFTAFKQSKYLQRKTLENVYEQLENRYNEGSLTDEQSDEIYEISQNKYMFTRAYLASTSYDTLKDFKLDKEIFTLSVDDLQAIDEIKEKYDDLEDIDEGSEDESRPERFDRPGNGDSAMSIADDATVDFFRGFPKIKTENKDGSFEFEKNELGYPVNHKYYDIFYKAKNYLSGAFNWKDMMARMNNKDNQRVFPELSLISNDINALLNNKTEKNHNRVVQNIQFLQSFYHAMVMPEVDNMQLTMNYRPLKTIYKGFVPTMVSFRKASRNLSLKIIQNWSKDFKDKRNKDYIDYREIDQERDNILTTPLYFTSDSKILLNPFVDYDKLFPKADKVGLRDFFMTLGVDINVKAYQDLQVINTLKEARNNIVRNISIYGKSRQLEFMAFAEDALIKDQVDTSDITSLSGYINKLKPYQIDVLASEFFISNPISYFNDKRQYTIDSILNGKANRKVETTSPLKFVFEDLAEIEGLFGDKVSSGSFRIEDKTKYPYYIPNQLLITTNLLNQIKNTGDFADQIYLSHLNPETNPWMKRSYFYSMMFDQNGQRKVDENGRPVQIVVEDIASVKTITEDEAGHQIITEKHPRSLSVDEKFVMDVLSMFSDGAIEAPRGETSSTMFSIRMSDYGMGKNLPIGFREVLGTEMPELFHQIVKNYFAAEIEKRQWFMKNEPDNKFAGIFNIFEGILSKELKDKIVGQLATAKADDILNQNDILTDFRKTINDYFLARTTDLLDKFNKNLSTDQQKMIKDTIKAQNVQSMNSIAKTFVLNQFILSQEFYTHFFGDLYYYKNPFKRGKFYTNTGTSYFIDETRNEMLNSIADDTLHSILTGQRAGAKDFRKYKTATITDVEMQSTYVDNDDRNNILLNDIVNMRLHSGTLNPGSPDYIKEIKAIKDRLQKYNKINIADGQGIISLDFYRNFSIMTKIWDEDKENEYKRQKAIFRSKTKSYFELDEDGNKVAINGDRLDQMKKEDEKLLNSPAFAFFNPLKISYTGPAAKAGPMRPVFDKFSVRPIIPEIAMGRRDESLLLEMAKKDVDYVKFQSGSKVYQDAIFDWYKQIADGKYDMNDYKTDEIEPSELYSAYLKHQLSTEGMKEENILGSQFRKIVFGIVYAPMVRNNQSLVNHFKGLEQQFFDRISELLKVEESDLFSLLGINKVGNGYKIQDMKKFLKLLTDESVKRGIAINNIDYLQYDEQTKTSKYPIDYAFNRQQIQDLLSGLIDERLRRLKVNGSPLFQVSSAGFESKSGFKNATEEDRKKYGTNGLHYYHINYDSNKNPISTSTMGVKVALIKEYKNLLNLPAPASLGGSFVFNPETQESRFSTDKIGTLERLNKAMQDTEWKNKHMDKFIMIGYRIPTQNNNFIDRMEVMEFLPESAGAIIVPPIELIIKSGSDFDIDKMNVLRPSINRRGDIESRPTETIDEINTEIRNLTFDERDKKSAVREYNNLATDINIDADKIFALQKKIRYTIIDLQMKAGINNSLLDKLLDNIANNKKAISSETKEDFEKFSDEDVTPASISLAKALDEYYLLDQKLEELKKKLSNTYSLKGEIESEDLKWFNKKRRYKNAIHNDLMDTLSKTISHPYYFEMLVTPSSASMFEGLTNELIASKENMSPEEYDKAMAESEDKLYDRTKTPEESSRYLSNLEAFDNLLSKRKDLGGYAIQRTFADVFNFINFSIAKNYTLKVGNEILTKVIHTPLIAPEDRNKVLQNGRISMHGDSIDGIPIKNSFDEAISLTVDLAGSPAYPKMDVNIYNKKFFQYLLHQKVSPKAALWFINQPILKELYDLMEKNKKRISGYTLKHGIVELALRMRMLENPMVGDKFPRIKYDILASKWVKFDEEKAWEEGKSGERRIIGDKANPYLSRPYFDLNNQNLSESDYFSIEDMDKAIRNKEGHTPFQKKILAYFGSMTDEADNLMKLQFANNVDTTKYSTLTALIRNRDNRAKLRTETTLFSSEQLNKLEKESMIAPFDYTKKAYEIQKALFPKLYTDETIATFANLVNDVFGAKNTQIERISKIVENDYIEYVYKNFGTYNGENLSDYFEPLLINTDNAEDHKFFSYDFLEIKGKYPELGDIPFVNAMYENIYFPSVDNIQDSYRGLDNREIHNLFFLRNSDNPTFEKNVFTTNWRNLINFNPEKLGLSEEYTDEQVSEISQFFHKLVYFSLYQSGLTNTGNGFSDLIPYEYWAHFIQNSFNSMDTEIAKNKSLGKDLLNIFEMRVKQMNPKINWQTKYILTGEYEEDGRPVKEELDFFKNYYRGKDFKVTDDDLSFVRDNDMFNEDEVADDVDIPKPETVITGYTIEPARYVKYDGKIYIVTKLTNRAKIWQIYNPTMEGPSSKLSVHERNLTPMKEKGTYVKYILKEYVVTAKDEIIDLKDFKKVTWGKNDINRIKIIQEARLQATPNDEIKPGNTEC